MPDEAQDKTPAAGILTQEQDALLDLYLKHLDAYLNTIKETEVVQVEIETLHLKRILSK